MNENINLCEILKGHESETFYYYGYGNVKLRGIEENGTIVLSYSTKLESLSACTLTLNGNGKLIYDENVDIMLFPAKDQRDWNKWIEEQKPKTPKTWEELVKNKKVNHARAEIHENGKCTYCAAITNASIAKSALALLKIHQLIEICYGGNVSSEECDGENVYYSIQHSNATKRFVVMENKRCRYNIAFHSEEQAEEFLSYPENVQLLKDYYMIKY